MSRGTLDVFIHVCSPKSVCSHPFPSLQSHATRSSRPRRARPKTRPRSGVGSPDPPSKTTSLDECPNATWTPCDTHDWTRDNVEEYLAHYAQTDDVPRLVGIRCIEAKREKSNPKYLCEFRVPNDESFRPHVWISGPLIHAIPAYATVVARDVV